jgi:hypothetical protein
MNIITEGNIPEKILYLRWKLGRVKLIFYVLREMPLMRDSCYASGGFHRREYAVLSKRWAHIGYVHYTEFRQ